MAGYVCNGNSDALVACALPLSLFYVYVYVYVCDHGDGHADHAYVLDAQRLQH